MPRQLSEQVVVITGASSGVDRETALSLAERGAVVVLAARKEHALRSVHDEVTRLRVLPQPVPPVHQPRVVADAVVHTITHPRPRVVVGGGKTLELVQRVAPRPGATAQLRAGKVVRKQRTDRSDDGGDNLFTQHPNRTRALLAGAALLALTRRGRR